MRAPTQLDIPVPSLLCTARERWSSGLFQRRGNAQGLRPGRPCREDAELRSILLEQEWIAVLSQQEATHRTLQ